LYWSHSGTRTDGVAGTTGDSPAMNQISLDQRAEHHASEAERLLTGKLGLINNVIKAGAHASLAVYYATLSQRS
jgi:hypothetical protein